MSNMEQDAGDSQRVTRRTSKVTTVESSLSDEVKSTPTKQVMRVAELQTENTPGTPRRGARALTMNSPMSGIKSRLNATPSQEASMSPLRRTTRSMSQEKDIVSAPPVRITRRRSSIANESESEDAGGGTKSTPQPKRTRMARKSTLLDKTINEEEAEDDSANDLELRTRSISKSPNGPIESPKSKQVEENSKSDMVKATSPKSVSNSPKSVQGSPKTFKPESPFGRGMTLQSENMLKTPVNARFAALTEKNSASKSSPKSAQKVPGSPSSTISFILDGISRLKSATSSPQKTPKAGQQAEEKVPSSPIIKSQDPNTSILSGIARLYSAKKSSMSPKNVEKSLKSDSPLSSKNKSIKIEDDIENAEEMVERETPQKLASPKAADEKQLKSWNRSFVGTGSEKIDRAFNDLNKSTPILQMETRRASETFELTSDESEDDEDKSVERNEFVIDEARVEGDDSNSQSLTESEKKFLDENEVPEHGESLGSEDSDVGEEEDEENDSFIAEDDDEVSDGYSMDSDEEKIEELKPRRSRIQKIESSSEEENEDETVEKDEAEAKVVESKTPEKEEVDKSSSEESDEEVRNDVAIVAEVSNHEPESMDIDESANEEEKIASPVLTSRKRKLDKSLNESIKTNEEVVAPPEMKNRKRKLDESMNESIQLTKKKIKLAEETPKVGKTKKIVSAEPPPIEAIVSKVNEYMNDFKEKKKKGLNLKRSLKAEKKLLKKKEASNDQEDDSSKENCEEDANKKKKMKKYRNKIKKQKSVEEAAQNQKEDVGAIVAGLQEKFERKRQKKLEKKKLKKQRQLENVPSTSDSYETSPPTKSNKEEVVVKNKKLKKQKQTVENGNAKPQQQVQVQEKKRKLDKNQDSDLDESVELKKPKKKLKIISEMSSKHSKSTSHLDSVNENVPKHKLQKQFSAPTLNKIKQIIPQDVKVEKSKEKKQKGFAFQEPKKFPPKPVWTSSGYFLEESVTPQKKSSKTIPVTFSGSVSVGLASGTSGESTKNKKNRMNIPMDFKAKALLLKQLQRDGSLKNMKGLMMKKI